MGISYYLREPLWTEKEKKRKKDENHAVFHGFKQHTLGKIPLPQ